MQFEDRRDAEEAYERYNSQYTQKADCLLLMQSRFNNYNLEGRRLRLDWDIGLNKKQEVYGHAGGRSSRSSPPRQVYICFSSVSDHVH